jgi:hypothetical protein
MSSTVFVLSLIVSLLIGTVGSYAFFRFTLGKRYIKHDTDEFKALFEVEFLKGIEEGEQRAMNRFSLGYDPFVEIKDSFFMHTADVGYTMQIFYNGLPLADPMKRVLNHDEKFKEENLKYLVDSVTNSINNLKPLGIPANINKNPQIKRNGKQAAAAAK